MTDKTPDRCIRLATLTCLVAAILCAPLVNADSGILIKTRQEVSEHVMREVVTHVEGALAGSPMGDAEILLVMDAAAFESLSRFTRDVSTTRTRDHPARTLTGYGRASGTTRTFSTRLPDAGSPSTDEPAPAVPLASQASALSSDAADCVLEHIERATSAAAGKLLREACSTRHPALRSE